MTQADRQKVCDLRSQQKEHEKQLEQLRKIWQQETNRLVSTVSSACLSLRYAAEPTAYAWSTEFLYFCQ